MCLIKGMNWRFVLHLNKLSVILKPILFMKKCSVILVVLFVIFSSCEGSDSYQGNWKALDSNGKKFEINFSPTKFTIKDSIGKLNTYDYTQNSIKSENSIETYGILLEDGRGYQIYFPKNDESVGLLLDENGKQMYTISRKNYITYEEIYKLN
jgi:hypothetical protein